MAKDAPLLFRTMATERTGARGEPARSSKNLFGVSELAFMKAEMGYALRVAGRNWAVSHWPGFQGAVRRRFSLLGNSILSKSIDNEARTALETTGHLIRTRLRLPFPFIILLHHPLILMH